MLINTRQKRNFLVGFSLFLIGSFLFWYVMSKNTNMELNMELNFLKSTYFVSLIIIPAYIIFENLSEKFKTEKSIKYRIKIVFLFLLTAIILYFLIILILKKF